MMRFLLVALLLLITFGTVAVASAETHVEALTKQCQEGLLPECSVLAYYYFIGIGVKQDFFTAVKFYQKACDGKDAGACSVLGSMYVEGTGVKQDFFTAVELYQKACDG